MMQKIIKSMLLMIILVAANGSNAESFYQSKLSLDKVMREFIKKNIALGSDESLSIKINSNDIPNRLRTCSSPIKASYPQDSTNSEYVTAVELTCSGNQAWHTFVPVDVQIYTPVIVAKNLIQANETITDDMIHFVKYDKSRLYNGFFKETKEVIGEVASHVITPGMVLTKRNVQRPLLVLRNQTVDLIAKTDTIIVTMKGVAKQEGGLNDVVKAYNPSSQKIIDAVVVGSGKLEAI